MKEMENKSPADGKKRNRLREDILFLLAKILVFALVLILMFKFVFGFVRVRDMSMKPAIMEGDLVLYYRMQKNFTAGDLLAVEKNGKTEIRRVAAVAGDTVDINESGLIVNGNLQQESNIYTKTQAYMEGITFPVTLTGDEVFVLGDKRDSAEDSRIYGPVSSSAAKGKVVAVFRRRNF